ncbi:MAG: hypothetical protein DRH15_07745, partial [Deltaproteobacteria bacterium]
KDAGVCDAGALWEATVDCGCGCVGEMFFFLGASETAGLFSGAWAWGSVREGDCFVTGTLA